MMMPAIVYRPNTTWFQWRNGRRRYVQNVEIRRSAEMVVDIWDEPFYNRHLGLIETSITFDAPDARKGFVPGRIGVLVIVDGRNGCDMRCAVILTTVTYQGGRAVCEAKPYDAERTIPGMRSTGRPSISAGYNTGYNATVAVIGSSPPMHMMALQTEFEDSEDQTEMSLDELKDSLGSAPTDGAAHFDGEGKFVLRRRSNTEN